MVPQRLSHLRRSHRTAVARGVLALTLLTCGAALAACDDVVCTPTSPCSNPAGCCTISSSANLAGENPGDSCILDFDDQTVTIARNVSLLAEPAQDVEIYAHKLIHAGRIKSVAGGVYIEVTDSVETSDDGGANGGQRGVIDVTGGDDDGGLEIFAGGDVTIGSELRSGPDGEVGIMGCLVSVPGAVLARRSNNNNPGDGSVEVRYRSGLTVAGQLRAGDSVDLYCRNNGTGSCTAPPSLTGTVIPDPGAPVVETLGPCRGCGDGVVDEFNGEICDDGDALDCTSACSAQCQLQGQNYFCGEPTACTESTCIDGSCVPHPVPNGVRCDDATVCNGREVCVSGTCTAGTPLACTPDSDDCTSDICHPSSGCVHPQAPNGTPCDDGNPCTDGTSCGGGTCSDGTLEASCIRAVVTIFEACGNGILNPLEQCDDGNLQAGDCCSPTCTFEAANSPCSDGNLCTTGDACNGAGTCAPGAACQVGTTCVGACGQQGFVCASSGPGNCTCQAP